MTAKQQLYFALSGDLELDLAICILQINSHIANDLYTILQINKINV